MLTVKGSPEDILAMAYGGKVPSQQQGQYLADGGVAEGPSHEEGGIPVGEQGAEEPMAEIEGGERVFSREDTAALEQAAEQIIQLQESGDQAGAEDMAKRLGFAVVNMIAAQEKSQAAQEQQMAGQGGEPAGPSPDEIEQMNQFE